MRRSPSFAPMAMLAILALILAACSGTNSGSSSAAAGSGSASASASATVAANGLCVPVGDASAEPTPSPSNAAPGSSDLKIGVVTDVGTLDDRNFNQYSWEGALRGAAAIGAAQPQNIVTTQSADYDKNIQSFVGQNYNIIVTIGFALGDATLAAAKANPNIHFIGVDQFQAGADAAAGAGLANYESVIFNEAQAGYLAGIVAASISKSGHIAAIGGSGTIPTVVNYMRGYENGAKSVKSDATVTLKYISDDLTAAFNDPTGGKTFGDQFLQQNSDVDVLFQVAGKTGNGLIQAAQAAGIYAIGVDVDQHASLPDSAECIVTSAEKKLTLAVSEGIIAVGGGSPRKGNVFYGADNDGIGLAPFYQFADLITSDIQSKIDDALGKMGGGTLDPCQPSNKCYSGTPDTGN
jgi:basic membrane protein A